MKYNDIKSILEHYAYYGHTVIKHKNNKYALTYRYSSIRTFAVDIIVHVIKFNQEKLVTKVMIGNKEINDEEELTKTLENIYKIHKQTLFNK